MNLLGTLIATTILATAPELSVGSKPFTESRLLAELFAQKIERDLGLDVERRINLGGTVIAYEALKRGDFDLYP